MNRALFSVLLAVGYLGNAAFSHADDWPQFRGPTGFGTSADKGLPTTWSETSSIVWKTELPGAGGSSAIIIGKKVFLTTYTGYGLDAEEPGDIKNLKRQLLCIERDTGKILWTRENAALQPEAPYRRPYITLHGYASSTPTSDGQRVFVFHGKSGVFAYDMDGKELWQVSVGKGTHGWGTGTSPILHKNLLIVNASVESSSLVALDKTTGKEVWRAKDITESWSTPALVKVPNGKTELVVSASHKIIGFDPDTGSELWHANSYNWYVCPSVIAHDGVVYGLQNSTCVAVRAGGTGDVTKTHTLWQKKFGSTVTSAVYHDGHIYWAWGGMARCLKASDGEVVYTERLKPNAGDPYSSPLAADGKIYYVSRTAGTFVVEASPKFKLLAHNTLDSSVFNDGPSVSNSQLLLRSDRYLYCIGTKK